MERYHITCNAISIFFLAALVFFVGIACQLTYAESDPKDSSSVINNDALRMAKYLATVKGYLSETRTALLAAKDGGKEYVASLFGRGSYGGIGDYQLLVGRQGSPEYAAFKSAIDTCMADPGGALITLEDQAYGPSLAYDNPNFGLLFRYQKMAESPYPLKRDSKGKYVMVYPEGQHAADNCVAMLKSRNASVVNAIKAYLDVVEKNVTTALSNVPATAAEREKVYSYARQAAKFAYETTKCIRPFKITLADNRYNRDNELYAQWVSCYKAGISSYIVSHQFITTSDANGPMYNEEIRSSAVQVNWDSYSCVVDRSAHVWSPVKGWKDGAKTHDLETFSPLVGNVNGKYPVDAMKAKCRAEWDFRVSQLTTVSKNDLKAAGNTLVAHCAGNFKADNDFYEIYQQSFGRHLCALNNILNKYKDLGLSVTQQFSGAVQTRHELFNPDDLTSQFYYISCGLNDFKDKDNQVPVIRITQSPTNDKPGTFNLSAAASYDPDGDVLRYRWVLTAMPDTLEAKSKTYVLYQKLSIAQVLAMILDLGGDWQVAVEVNDNKDASEMDIILAYSRKILWIAHSDNDIFLQRYHYVDAAKGIDTTFNLEVSSNPVGVYLNYNDAMEPVDSIAYTPATPGSCYSIQKNSVQPENAKGAYDGLYGSSIFTTGIRYNSIPGPLVLKSSSNRPGKACFEISVLDPDITDFVYSTVSCLYGARKHRPEALQGFFTVKQWIDKSAWLNPDGLGFVEYKKENATAYHECPDWMEEQAARVIQGHAILREYVGRIVVAAKNENENRDRYGHYIPGTRFICLNPYINDIRWNLPACNAYGFYGKNCLENTALHEAFHCFYYQTIHKGVYVNKDKDGLPGEPYSGMFAYLLDDNTNYCGAKLLGSLLEINADDPHYDYLGDGEYDYASGETKFFYSKGSLADVQGKVCPSVTIPVPRPLPMPAYRVFIEEVFVQTGVNSMKMLYRPKYGSDFSYVVEKKKSGVQNIIITFNSAIFNDNLQRWIFDKNNKNASLFVEFSATMPFHPEEYDASRIEPATYVDIENEG